MCSFQIISNFTCQSSIRSFNVFNYSDSPTSFSWDIPQIPSVTVKVSPSDGILLPNQNNPFKVTITPLEPVAFSTKVTCYAQHGNSVDLFLEGEVWKIIYL